MSREYVYLIAGILLGMLPFCGYFAYKKIGIFDIRPDRIVIYKEVDGVKLSLHVFDAKTKKDASTHPALLLFHGGAWQFGSPQSFYQQCDYFLRLGLTCISVQYRIESLHGTNPAAAVQDARMALRYLYQQARALNIDPSKIAVGGGSSGGHLAATLGVPIPLPDDNSDASVMPRPKALILYNPMLDLSPCHPDHYLVADFWRDVSPMQSIDGHIPPTLILLGTEDREVPVPTAKKFCDSMTIFGGRCELALYEGAKHGFFNYEINNGRFFHATNQRVAEFLRQMGFISNETGSLDKFKKAPSPSGRRLGRG